MAVAVTQTLLAFRYFGRKGVTLLVLTLGLSLGAVYGGFHYAIDVIAGVITGAAITPLGIRVFGLGARRAVQANAIAPT